MLRRQPSLGDIERRNDQKTWAGGQEGKPQKGEATVNAGKHLRKHEASGLIYEKTKRRNGRGKGGMNRMVGEMKNGDTSEEQNTRKEEITWCHLAIRKVLVLAARGTEKVTERWFTSDSEAHNQEGKKEKGVMERRLKGKIV